MEAPRLLAGPMIVIQPAQPPIPQIEYAAAQHLRRGGAMDDSIKL